MPPAERAFQRLDSCTLDPTSIKGSRLVGVRLAAWEVGLDPLEGVVQDHGAYEGRPCEQEPPVLVHQRPAAPSVRFQGRVEITEGAALVPVSAAGELALPVII